MLWRGCMIIIYKKSSKTYLQAVVTGVEPCHVGSLFNPELQKIHVMLLSRVSCCLTRFCSLYSDCELFSTWSFPIIPSVCDQCSPTTWKSVRVFLRGLYTMEGTLWNTLFIEKKQHNASKGKLEKLFFKDFARFVVAPYRLSKKRRSNQDNRCALQHQGSVSQYTEHNRI